MKKLDPDLKNVKTATKKQFIDAVTRFGCTYEMDDPGERGQTPCITIDAPKGFIFAENGCHCLVEPFENFIFSVRPRAYHELIERLRYGLVPCTDPDCDICNDY